MNTSGPVFIHGVALPSTNDDYNVTVQGRFETTHSTSPVYNMSLGASCYLNIKNSTLVTPHTESISSSGAESVILMNTYSNKATGASVTELVDTLNVDAQVY